MKRIAYGLAIIICLVGLAAPHVLAQEGTLALAAKPGSEIGPYATALGPDGRPWAAWESWGQNGESEIWYSRLAERGWEPPAPIDPSSSGEDTSPALAFDSYGVPWAAWSRGAEGRLLYARWIDGAWETPLPVDGITSSANRGAALELGPDGSLWLAWSGLDGQDEEIFTARWEGAAWESVRTVSADEEHPESYDVNPHLAVGPSGLWVVWTGYDPAAGSDEIFASRWDGISWGPEERVNRPDGLPDFCPSIAVDQTGAPWVAWAGFNGKGYSILWSRREADHWSAEAILADLGSDTSSTFPSISIGADGRPEVVWNTHAPGVSLLGWSRWDGSAWTPARQLGARGGTFPLLSHDAAGTPVVLSLGESARDLTVIEPQAFAQPMPLLSTQVASLASESSVSPLTVQDRYDGFGDSITWGYYNKPNGYPNTPYEIYLEPKLDNEIRPSEVPNSGVPGERTDAGVVRFPGVIASLDPQYVLIMEGTNDVKWQYPAQTTVNNLSAMIDIARAHGTIPLIATLPPVSHTSNAPTRQRNDLIRSMAASKDVPLAEMYDAILSYSGSHDWTYYYVSGVHPWGPLMVVISDEWFDTLTNSIPPESFVKPLPEYTRSKSFTVHWTGRAFTDIKDYDVQYKVDSGSWQTWLSDTTQTSATFGPASPAAVDYGHTYYFRCRAEDTLGNQEDYPADADAQITVARAIYGTVMGNRGTPMLGATVTITPSGYTTGFSYHDGSYEAFISSTGSYTSEVKASKAGFGALPPMYGVQVPADDSVGNVDFVLPPGDDVVTNGGFESGDDDWATGGTSPTFLSDYGHTGTGYAKLAPTSGGTSTLSQGGVYIDDTNIVSPTLSFMYWYTSGAPSDYLQAEVNSTPVKTITASSDGWAHGWAGVSNYAGLTVTLTLKVSRGSGGTTYAHVDEVSLGSAAPEPVAIYLPFAEKRYYGD